MEYVNYENLKTAKEMIKVALEKKVDKEDGKGLSTNDYTNEEKLKLTGIEEEANKTIVDSELSLESTNPVQNKIVSEELNTKANKIEVEEALNTKADKVAVEEALNTKADKVAVEEALNTKADKIAIKEALETKADKQEVAEALDTKVDKEFGKGLSTNDFTNEEKEKLSKLDEKSNENIIEVVKQNGQVLEITDKSVNIVTITEDTIDNKIENAVKNVEVDLTDYAKRSDIPKNVSDLFNDKAFISSSDEKDPTVPAHVKAITEEDIEKWNSGTGTGSGSESCNVVVDAVEPSNGEAIWIKLAKNLCHFNNVKDGYSINSAGKVISDYMWNKWLATDFIEVEPDTVYTLSGIQYGTDSRYHAWYDSNKNPISAFVRYLPTGQSSQTVTSPSNAKYIRFSIYNGYGVTEEDERLYFQFEKGSKATSYAPYSGKSDMFVKNSNGEYEQIYEAFPVPLPENEQYTLPPATASTLGGIKVGDNLTIDADGTLNAQAGSSGGNNIIVDNGETVIDVEQSNGAYMWIHNSTPFTLTSESITKIPFDKLVSDTSNGKLIHENGGIRIGPGVKQILVLTKWNSWTYNCQKYVYVYKNGTLHESAGFATGAWTANVVSYVDVQEGDFIETYGYHNYGSNMNIASNSAQSGLKVIILSETTNVEFTGDVTTHSDSAAILYDNEEGSNGPITLSENLSNFKYVDIFYSYLGDQWGYDYTRIYKPNGKLTNLSVDVLNNEKMYTSVSTWVLNGTEIRQVKGERYRFAATPEITRTADLSEIYIHRVIGYHEESNVLIIGSTGDNSDIDLTDYLHKDDLYYKKGDKMIIDFPITVPGLVTSSTKRLMFTITSPKLLTNIDSIICTKCNAELRGNNGYVNNQSGYLEYTATSGYTVSCAKACENMIQIYVDKSSSYTNISNNTMVIIRAYFEFDLL